ncbi:hypothetical protein Q5P01_012071 [Channa striata]|uniref:Uncharacterized protein n=1 Tax=Channa striata TaxID=64152 RepID=A0AA88MMZ5_CHASR|nr:hypothetical protein Q5P01_012071 [Channa striata]
MSSELEQCDNQRRSVPRRHGNNCRNISWALWEPGVLMQTLDSASTFKVQFIQHFESRYASHVRPNFPPDFSFYFMTVT